VIDVNAYLGRWPFRHLPLEETVRLIEKLSSLGIRQAWVSPFEALLHRDVSGVNARLVAECRKSPEFLVPFGAVNPVLPGWQSDLRRCAEEYGMPGIRLFPGYHGYPLDDPRFAELLDLAGELGLVVQIAVTMEDDRTQHPLLRVPAVDVKPVPGLLKSRPELKIVLLNAFKTITRQQAGELAAAGRVSFEIAMLEGIGGVERLLETVPLDRLLLGTYAPFFIPESALLKLQESELGETRRTALASGNAERLLSRKG